MGADATWANENDIDLEVEASVVHAVSSGVCGSGVGLCARGP